MMEALDRLANRLALLIGRGKLQTGNDSGNVQLLQAQLGQDEVHDNLPRLGEYGHASMPPANADVLVLFVGGDRANGVVIATGHIASRLRNLQPGESAIYDDLGQKVHLTRNGIVVSGAGLPITATNTSSITLDTPTVHMKGSLNVDGAITANGNVASSLGDLADASGKTLAAARTAYNLHTHTDPQGGVSGPPSAPM